MSDVKEKPFGPIGFLNGVPATVAARELVSIERGLRAVLDVVCEWDLSNGLYQQELDALVEIFQKAARVA